MGAWNFKGEGDNSQDGGKSTCLVNKCLPSQAETMGHRDTQWDTHAIYTQWDTGPAGPSQLTTPRPHCL